MSRSRAENLRRIARIAWPVFVGQLAVIGFSTGDTVLLARASPEDLAALSVGTAAHAAIFIGMWGVVLAVALSNTMMARVSQRVGARDPQDAGRLGWHGMQFGCAACSPDP